MRITQERVDGKPKNHVKSNSPYGAFAIIDYDGNILI